MRDLHISASQFGLVVSAYAFSAGVSGFLAAGFADRFDRKKLLLFFYAGFSSARCCAASPHRTTSCSSRASSPASSAASSARSRSRSSPTCSRSTSAAASWASCRRRSPPARSWGCPLGLFLSEPLGLARAVPDDPLVLDGRGRPHRHLHEADRRSPQAAAPGAQRVRPPDQDRVAQPAICAPSRPRRCW